MNPLDRIISFVNPMAGLRREQARTAATLLRKYEGASRTGRTSGWRTTGADATRELSGDLNTLRNRSRDLVRNNPYAAKAVGVIATNTVGTGIRATVKGAKKVQKDWLKWAETTACDWDGRNNLYGLQDLVMRTVATSGEALILKRRTTTGLKLQVLEGDYIDDSRDGTTNAGNEVIMGVEFNAKGERVGYWLWSQHPGSNRVGFKLESQFYSTDQVIHVFLADRPDQIRGVPMGVASFIRTRDLDEYEDAQLLRQKIAACYAAFVTDDSDLGSGDNDSIPDRIRPGTIEKLPSGKSVTFATPPPVENYAEYMRTVLHSIAAAYGVTYEALTGDLSQVNFSSARMGWLEFQRNVSRWQWNLLIPQMCDGVFRWYAEFAEIMGTRDVTASWTPPRREMIDPGKEISALEQAVRAGFITQKEAMREQGYEPADMFAEMAETNAEIDKLGLKLTTDARYFQQAGKQPQEKPAEV